MLHRSVDTNPKLIDFFYDKVEQAKKAGQFAKTSRLPDPDTAVDIYASEEDGVQPADLKRLGQNNPKVYVHKDGKTILIPRNQAKDYIARGWKKSALRAETSYESKLAELLNQRLK